MNSYRGGCGVWCVVEVVRATYRTQAAQGAPKGEKKKRRTYLPTFFEVFCDFQV
jgi:hypothetical protein